MNRQGRAQRNRHRNSGNCGPDRRRHRWQPRDGFTGTWEAIDCATAEDGQVDCGLAGDVESLHDGLGAP
jgi:hypothetical protein